MDWTANVGMASGTVAAQLLNSGAVVVSASSTRIRPAAPASSTSQCRARAGRSPPGRPATSRQGLGGDGQIHPVPHRGGPGGQGDPLGLQRRRQVRTTGSPPARRENQVATTTLGITAMPTRTAAYGAAAP